MLRARRFSTPLNAPRCGVRSIRFSGYSSPSSSTIRSALWENAHPSLAAVGVLLATAGGALLLISVLSCSPRWSQEGQHQKTVTNCICKPKHFVTLETRAIKDFEPAAAKTFLHGTKYRPTPDREAFNHKTLRLQIQPARYPQMRPQHHVQPLTNPPGHVQEPHERYRCKTTTKPTAATRQPPAPKLH